MSQDNGDGRGPWDDGVTECSSDAPATDEPDVRAGWESAEAPLQAGQMIGQRYRIVGPLGRGGMGEVYRADDLTLGTSVALKFLPVRFASDPVRLEHLKAEVRIARQVSHPNVCRVFDIGEAGGRWFLSMEYIDGEDLSSLLRRIGRLPPDKAVELARQICAGVAAAHEHDIIHRDLKPANVMIDGRGRARVTDFGLAGALADLEDQAELLAGTPAYMAPEQLLGDGVNKRSDIYALGLVLYELFTGKPAHRAKTIAELLELHSSSSPLTSPLELIEDMDRAVERVIMCCLEANPRDRPPTALAVLAALPGGDPLAAMLEAGETPSPELVAASGRPGTLSTGQALGMAALCLTALLLVVWFFGEPSLSDMVGGLLPPQVLEHRAREILASAGYADPPADTAWGYDMDRMAVGRLAGRPAAERAKLLRAVDRPLVRFWYRQSPAPMQPWLGSLPGGRLGDVVRPQDPPLTEPGMGLVWLGPRGRLLELRAVPTETAGRETPPEADASTVEALLEAAGVDSGATTGVTTTVVSPMPGETTLAWVAPDRGQAGIKRMLEATFSESRLTWFRSTAVDASDGDPGPAERTATRVDHATSLVFFGFFAGGAVLAVVNLRARRWDRRGALRLAVVVFGICLATTLIQAHHTFTPAEEARRTFSVAAYAATRALMTWLLYVAMEPLIRRLHPTSLVSWSRLLAGRLDDPAVGRDVLVGLTVAALHGVAVVAWFWVRGWHGVVAPVAAFLGGAPPLTAASGLALTIRMPVVAVGFSLGFLLVYVLLRAALGRARAAAPACLWLLILVVQASLLALDFALIDHLVFIVIAATAYTFVAVRGGLLAFVVCWSAALTLVYIVPTVDLNEWFFAPTLIFALAMLGLLAYGVRTSTAGAPLLSWKRP